MFMFDRLLNNIVEVGQVVRLDMLTSRTEARLDRITSYIGGTSRENNN